MAQARKCDRCGALHECDDSTNVIRFSETRIGGATHYGTRCYDLCLDCMKQLQQWLSCKGELKEAE